MDLITVRELYKHPENYLDKEVSIGGWVRSLRDSKAFGFIVVSDGSYFETLQVVYHDSLSNFAEISKMNVGTAIIAKGTLVATPQAKQPFEIQATEVTVEGASASDYPLRKNATPLSICARFPICVQGPIPSSSIPCALPGCVCHPSVFPGTGFCICAHTADNRQ